jgi:hypothetical protein
LFSDLDLARAKWSVVDFSALFLSPGRVSERATALEKLEADALRHVLLNKKQ